MSAHTMNHREPVQDDHWLNIIPRSLKWFYPMRILLQIYSSIILTWDVIWLLVFSFISIINALLSVVWPPPLKSVRDEVVMVVGSGRGVGKDIVKQMTALGAIVICVDINKKSNEATAYEAQQLSHLELKRVWSYTCDVTNRNDVLKLAIDVKNDLGDITMLFHCCSIPSPRSLLTEPPSDIHKTLDLTITSQFWLLDAFLPMMKKRNHGHIVVLTSVAGLNTQRGLLPLGVAQFAVQGLAETVLEELRISKICNVHVTIVHIYPFILNADTAKDIRLRIPSFFGTTTASYAAKAIIEAVRRNYIEVSIPKHFIFLGHLLRILPRDATVMIRDMLDTGVDFA